MKIVRNQLDQKTWDVFVLEHGPRSGRFLQSWEWGEFSGEAGPGSAGQKKTKQIDRFSWIDGDKLIAVAQVIQKKISGFGSYGYIPRGPIVIGDEELDITPITQRSLFIRIEPEDVNKTALLHRKKSPLFLKSRNIQPAHTLITNLPQSEEQLFSNMHEKTRYNIRLAEKKGVQIEIGTATIDDVWHVFEMTSARDQFRLHQKSYYAKMIETLSDPPFIPPFARGEGTHAFLATASHDGEILAVNIMMDFGDTRTYLHGASSNVKRNFMAPYLLHWALMKDAKLHGIKFYDWWGVAPQDADEHHPWAGISRFKRGFGGEEVSYPGTFDLILSPIRYTLYQLVRKIPRLLNLHS